MSQTLLGDNIRLGWSGTSGQAPGWDEAGFWAPLHLSLCLSQLHRNSQYWDFLFVSEGE